MLGDLLSKCKGRLSNIGSKVCSLLHSDLGVQLPLHISLSRPVVLATEQKQPFIEGFERAVQSLDTRPYV